MGAPGKPSVSGFAGGRRNSGVTALSALKAETKDTELAATRAYYAPKWADHFPDIPGEMG